MKSPEIQILSTKKLTALQRNLLKYPLILIDEDFVKIEFVEIQKEDIKYCSSTVIFTSQNAVKSLLDDLEKSELCFEKIFCVGEKTKQYLEKNNFEVTHFEHYSKNLADYIVNQKEINEVTFFCGNSRLDELPNTLKTNHIKVNEVVVYKTVLNQIPITNTFDGILFFSPSGVQSYLMAKNSVKPKAFCIGTTTALSASNYFNEIVVVDNPTIEDVIHKVNQYYV
ncbi:MAG: uroporphyrinogen-III synthase [Flavobacteriaceae bacterium]|nr:uroporphyrinogen-III synthase [Flavobacteriaceae bacterium]